MPVLPRRDQPQHQDAPVPPDMSDAEWAVAEPALPAPAWTLGKGGRPAGYCRRDIADGIRYLVKEGIQWRAVPADFPALAHHLRLRQRVGENRRDREHAR